MQSSTQPYLFNMISEEVQDYFDLRMSELGVTAENNCIDILEYDAESKENKLMPVQIFKPVERGIEIMVYTLDRLLIPFAKEGSRWKNKNYSLLRLLHPLEKNGQYMKYVIPKGQGTYPFFPPVLLEKFEKKETIDTLFLVEGFFKAWKASMAGCDIIGLSSITHMKEREKGTLHPDILRILKTCLVKKIVWLTDGDCLDVTNKEFTDGMDLYRRPKQFFNTVTTFKTLVDDFDAEKWFIHIDIDSILSSRKEVTRDLVKGIDDLLCALPEEAADIIAGMKNMGTPSEYFQKFNVTYSTQKAYRHFRLGNVNEFYLFHSERRQDLKNKEFVFNGTKYKFSDEKNECVVMVPSEATNYFRVGDTYYKYIQIPNKYGQPERQFRLRQKGTITDDHGKNFYKHIPKYEAFCNVPDHVNFQTIIHNNFNLYSPLDHEQEDGESTEDDCPTIMKFVQHIFGHEKVKYKNLKTGKDIDTEYYQLGLDYIQLLYTKPTQKLPILCLVSRENETGKSTFAMLLKNIFTANAAIVGNADLADNFNAHWASKLLIVCDETKIDKQSVVEKVKSLSTADKIMMNAKGKDHVELDFFGKFMFLTNNEENFIYASDEDLRYWVIKVPRIKDKNPDLMEQMMEEIPMFLSYMSRRQMVTEKTTRMWFDPTLLKTEALKKVIKHSMPTIEKEIRQHLKDMFLDFGVEEIWMTRKDLHQEFFNGKYEANYLESVLKDKINVDVYHVFETPNGKRHLDLATAEQQLIEANPDITEMELAANVTRRYLAIRHSYPRWEKITSAGGTEMKRVDVKCIGRAYQFKRADFVSDAEWNAIDHDSETKQLNLLTKSADIPGELDELPFPIKK